MSVSSLHLTASHRISLQVWNNHCITFKEHRALTGFNVNVSLKLHVLKRAIGLYYESGSLSVLTAMWRWHFEWNHSIVSYGTDRMDPAEVQKGC